MKKHYPLLLLSLLFLVFTAMTCDDDEPIETVKVPCTIDDVTLHHWNNAGEYPKEPAELKIPKEAYLLEICVSTVITEDESVSYDDSRCLSYVLSDEIKKISIFTDAAFYENFPAGAEVTSCFYNYPKTISDNQRTDYTANGNTIYYVEQINRIYKALLAVPQPGKYRFRVVLTMESGETIERISEPITLY